MDDVITIKDSIMTDFTPEEPEDTPSLRSRLGTAYRIITGNRVDDPLYLEHAEQQRTLEQIAGAVRRALPKFRGEIYSGVREAVTELLNARTSLSARLIEIEDARKETQEAKADVARLQQEMASAKTAVEQLSAEQELNTKKDDEIAKLKNELEQANAAIQAMQAREAGAEKLTTGLQDEINSLQSQLSRVKDDYDSVVANIVALAAELTNGGTQAQRKAETVNPPPKP
jgi:chromosome segregation ATPase